MVATLIASWGLARWPHAHRREITTEVVGADVSRAGGVRVRILNEHGALTQTCSGVCDDFAFEADSPDNVYKAEVRDASGRCVLCDGGSYVTGGTQVRWRLAGHDRLVLKEALASNY